ncbi:MAG: tyrosine--tRNA ligase [Thaumarchaeota archaeon]|nr:tyrosine--tRNA ligase [Nitrososphaerota archaeon]
MDLEKRLDLVSRPPTEEVVARDELRHLFETTSRPKHYIGLEISGLLHLGSLVLTGFKIRDFLEAGVECIVFLADWHSYINNKFRGDWSKIGEASRYYEEAFKAFCPGVKIVLGSDLYLNNNDYWRDVVRFSKQITLARATRCLTIMGRSEKEKLDFSQYLYPPMQSVDIHAMDLDIAHAGMDQRKVHMLAREVFPRLGWKVPVAVHHHLLPGLSEPIQTGVEEDAEVDKIISSKMSKSKPWTAIFIHDSSDEVRGKLRKAWCPEGVVDQNPILDLAKNLVFHEKTVMNVERPPKFGGTVSFDGYDTLEAAYRERKIHPADLKTAMAKEIDSIISPIRKHFEERSGLLDVFRSEA